MLWLITEVALALGKSIAEVSKFSSYELTVWKVRNRITPLGDLSVEAQARWLKENIKGDKGPLEREIEERKIENRPTAKEIAAQLGVKTKPLSELV